MTETKDDEIAQLRQQIADLVERARDNESKLERFNDIELRLIGATSLEQTATIIADYLPQQFALDNLTLILLDPEYDAARALESNGTSGTGNNWLILLDDPRTLQRLFEEPPQPLLGRYSAAEHGELFARRDDNTGSVALIPIMRRDELIGALNLASHDAERFSPQSGPFFLQRLGAVLAICLENCLNHHRLRLLGLTDPLTGVNNRRYFDQRLEEEVAAAGRHAAPLSCLLVDVDHFKRINDTYGHQVGDLVLHEVAALIQSQLRGCDVCCRYGGEEFVALLPDTPLDQAREIAERIRSHVAAHQFRPDSEREITVTVSLGGALLDPGGAAALVHRADSALYEAKASGRNRVVLRPPSASRAG